MTIVQQYLVLWLIPARENIPEIDICIYETNERPGVEMIIGHEDANIREIISNRQFNISTYLHQDVKKDKSYSYEYNVPLLRLCGGLDSAV